LGSCSLRGQFQDLIKLDFDVELTGFSTGVIDLLIDGSQQSPAADPADDPAGLAPEGPAISQFGDVWELGRHRLVCGDAQRGETYKQLLRGELAEMMVRDPPYNVRIDCHAMGRGKVRHREFAMASGEMSAAAFSTFLSRFIRMPSAPAVTELSTISSWIGVTFMSCSAPLSRFMRNGKIFWFGTMPDQGSF
jgi:hypothetical protein